jgi:hypothetical protein
MSIFRDNVLGFIPEKDWLTVGFDVTRQNDPIDGLFGDEKTDNLVAYWQSIANEYQIPVMAQFHGFDVEAQKTFRVPIDTHNIEKGLIKVKMNQSERLRELMRSGVQGDERLYDYVMNDGLRLAEQVVTRTKVAKNELLATGKVTIKENDLDLTVDYGVPAANLQKTLDFGAGATATIPEQLQELVDETTAKGISLTGMVLPRAVLTKLRQNEAVQKSINGALMVGQLVRNADLRAYLNEEFGISEVITNDLTYNVAGALNQSTGIPALTAHRYFPANKVSFFAPNASGRIGTGLWGDPPEVDAARAFDGGVAASGESPFVYISQWGETDPAVLWTKASALFMPVLYNPNALYVASVIETPGA